MIIYKYKCIFCIVFIIQIVKIFKLKTTSKFEEKNLNLTIGNFDGVDLCHQIIIKQLIKISKKNNYRSTILSFNPHPREFFSTINEPFNIITSSYKKNLFESLGLDIFVDFSFDKHLSSLDPAEFIKLILIEKLSVKNIIIGSDFKFGKDRKGDLLLLQKEAEKYKFNVKVIEPIINLDTQIKFSSSLIRQDIKNGLFEKVNLAK